VDRRVLDFDFEPVCSVSLATTNIYVCLACGKFFQGTTSFSLVLI
jgi:U4/U6.U5 tri-snRNP-associated protein 2